MNQINDERFAWFAAAGAAGDSLNDLEVSYWRDIRLYAGESLNDLRQAWKDAGSPDPTPPHQMDV